MLKKILTIYINFVHKMNIVKNVIHLMHSDIHTLEHSKYAKIIATCNTKGIKRLQKTCPEFISTNISG